MSEVAINKIPASMLHSKASDIDIARAEQSLNRKLPREYRQFVGESDGAEGFIDETTYVHIFQVGELYEINKAAEIEDFAPGFLIFGSNGGGISYAFDYRRTGIPVVAFYDEEMNRESASVVAANFDEFVNKMAGGGITLGA